MIRHVTVKRRPFRIWPREDALIWWTPGALFAGCVVIALAIVGVGAGLYLKDSGKSPSPPAPAATSPPPKAPVAAGDPWTPRFTTQDAEHMVQAAIGAFCPDAPR